MKTNIKTIGYSAALMLLALQISLFGQNTEFDAGMKAAQAADFQQAVVHFQKALDKNPPVPRQAQIHYNAGVCFYQLKQPDKAVAELERAVLLKPDYEKAFYALGMAYTDLETWNLAEMAFQKAIKLAGNRSGEAWFDLAFVYVYQKDYDRALESFQKAVKHKSVAAAASHNNIGVIYAIKGSLQIAFKEIELAKKLGYEEAEDNLKYLREVVAKNDKTLISKLILKKAGAQ